MPYVLILAATTFIGNSSSHATIV